MPNTRTISVRVNESEYNEMKATINDIVKGKIDLSELPFLYEQNSELLLEIEQLKEKFENIENGKDKDNSQKYIDMLNEIHDLLSKNGNFSAKDYNDLMISYNIVKA